MTIPGLAGTQTTQSPMMITHIGADSRTAFLFGERALKNVMPLVTEFRVARSP